MQKLVLNPKQDQAQFSSRTEGRDFGHAVAYKLSIKQVYLSGSFELYKRAAVKKLICLTRKTDLFSNASTFVKGF